MTSGFLPRLLGAGLMAATLGLNALPVAAQSGEERLMRDARDAYQRKDKSRLASLRLAAVDTRHPLATWIDYWDLSGRLNEATPDEVQAFYGRWPGSFVEDRLRNDWLLELGARRDWSAFAREYPRFRMDDDREVHCYALLVEHQTGEDVRARARRAWLAQREPDQGCQLLAKTLYDAGRFSNEDIWRKVRHTAEHNRPRAGRLAASILGEPVAKAVGEVFDSPARYLATRAIALGHHRSELAALALARMAASDPAAAAQRLEASWGAALGGEHGAWAWAQVAKQGALDLHPQALEWTRTAFSSLKRKLEDHPDWSDETLGWLARSALRLGQGPERWQLTLRAVAAMSPNEQADPTWRYWRARAQLALSKPSPASGPADPIRQAAENSLAELAGEFGFYGQLAAEDLGAPQSLPARPAAISATEKEATRRHAGLQRALAAIDMSFRTEGVREWNFSLIGMNDRELLAAAELACQRELWDRCIHTAERARLEVDLSLRFPMPFRSDIQARAREAGLEPALMYGLIRQESRFITVARSGAGAAGLMQVMPATASWTAKRIGLPFQASQLTDPETNLRLGAAYLKMMLDDLDGSFPMAAAAYNAGPGRPKRWREGPSLEAAVWIEHIPIHETRDYVKKVSSNAAYYAGLMSGKPASLKARLGERIGPRNPGVPVAANAAVDRRP